MGDIIDLASRLWSRYREIMAEAKPEIITSKTVIDFINQANDYLTCLSNKAGYEGGHNEVVIERVKLRNAAKIMLNRTMLLDVSNQKLLQEFICEQPEFLPGEYKFTTDFFSVHINQWKKDLEHFMDQANIEFLEIGSFEGRSATWMLTAILTHESAHLTCLDTFDFAGQGYIALKDLGLESMSIESRFDYNIQKTGAASKVTKLLGRSCESLRSLPFDNYDFIYIDGSHVAVDVLEDAVLAWRLLKEGGRLTFDDYEWQEASDPLLLPRMAIDAFLSIYKGRYNLICKSYQVTVEKISSAI